MRQSASRSLKSLVAQIKHIIIIASVDVRHMRNDALGPLQCGLAPGTAKVVPRAYLKIRARACNDIGSHAVSGPCSASSVQSLRRCSRKGREREASRKRIGWDLQEVPHACLGSVQPRCPVGPLRSRCTCRTPGLPPSPWLSRRTERLAILGTRSVSRSRSLLEPFACLPDAFDWPSPSHPRIDAVIAGGPRCDECCCGEASRQAGSWAFMKQTSSGGRATMVGAPRRSGRKTRQSADQLLAFASTRSEGTPLRTTGTVVRSNVVLWATAAPEPLRAKLMVGKKNRAACWPHAETASVGLHSGMPRNQPASTFFSTKRMKPSSPRAESSIAMANSDLKCRQAHVRGTSESVSNDALA